MVLLFNSKRLKKWWHGKKSILLKAYRWKNVLNLIHAWSVVIAHVLLCLSHQSLIINKRIKLVKLYQNRLQIIWLNLEFVVLVAKTTSVQVAREHLTMLVWLAKNQKTIKMLKSADFALERLKDSIKLRFRLLKIVVGSKNVLL